MSSYSESDTDSDIDMSIEMKNSKVQRLADGIARAEARLDVLDEAVEDTKDELNSFLQKHGEAKSAIYCYGHFRKIDEIKELEELEQTHFNLSMKLSAKFIEQSHVVRNIVRKKAVRDKLMRELSSDAGMGNEQSTNGPVGNRIQGDVEEFVNGISGLESYVRENGKEVMDQILDPELNGQLG